MIETIEYGSLPALRICAPDGAQAIITLYGAHLVSWKSADGRERLFVSARSALDGSRAIRGGVPVIFPQFAERGNGMRHGFARVSNWVAAENGSADGAAFAALTLSPQELAPAHALAWPGQFALRLVAAVRGSSLRMSLEVRNTGTQAFPFSAALHTYHSVPDIGQVRIEGVRAGTLAIGEELDQIFHGVGGPVGLAAGEQSAQIEMDGFCDVVVWNPGAEAAAGLADMGDDEYQRFVCVEPALITPMTLAPGSLWQGSYEVNLVAPAQAHCRPG